MRFLKVMKDKGILERVESCIETDMNPAKALPEVWMCLKWRSRSESRIIWTPKSPSRADSRKKRARKRRRSFSNCFFWRPISFRAWRSGMCTRDSAPIPETDQPGESDFLWGAGNIFSFWDYSHNIPGNSKWIRPTNNNASSQRRSNVIIQQISLFRFIPFWVSFKFFLCNKLTFIQF